MMKHSCKTTLVLLTLLLLSGCMKVGHRLVSQDRFDYSMALSESQKEQTLLNIVKLRYSEWPMFMEIDQVVTQYTIEGSGFLKGIAKTPWSGDNDQVEAGLAAKYSERPTIAFKPLKGAKFAKVVLTPVKSASLYALVQTGWPVDRLMETFVHAANGRENIPITSPSLGKPVDAFGRLTGVLRKMQLADALDIEFDFPDADPDAVPDGKPAGAPPKAPSPMRVPPRATLVIHPDLVEEGTAKEWAEVKELMGMAADWNRFEVIWGSRPADGAAIAIQTRSIIQVLDMLSTYVDVPAKDIAEGRVFPREYIADESETGLKPLLRVRNSKEQPGDAFIKVKYRDRWFYIADTDVNSKLTMAYLSLLLMVGDAESSETNSVLIITTN